MPAGMLSAWLEWKARCAADLCSTEARAAIRAFGMSRFRRYTRHYVHRTNLGDAETLLAAMTPANAWHLFETHLCVRSGRQGKRYKDWLFARECPGQPPLSLICGGVAMLMRDVVREHLRNEFPPASVMPWGEKHDLDAEAEPCADVLLSMPADPASGAHAQELQTLAASFATRFFAQLDPRQRLLLLAKALGVSLAHPVVRSLTGRGKSALFAAYVRLAQRMAAELETLCPRETPDTLRELSLAALRELQEQAFLWGRPEKSCAPIFSIVEGMEDGNVTTAEESSRPRPRLAARAAAALAPGVEERASPADAEAGC